MNTSALIDVVSSLPIEERALLAESLLLSLNQQEPEIDEKWSKIAVARLKELRNGQIKPIDGEHVFSKIWQRFDR